MISREPLGKTNPFSSEETKKINKRPVRKNSEGSHMAVGVVMWDALSLDRGNRRLSCNGGWRKSLKCQYNTDGFYGVFRNSVTA